MVQYKSNCSKLFKTCYKLATLGSCSMTCNFLVGEPELNIWLCVVSVWCPVYPGWMRCSNRSERKDNCTVTISVYSTCVHTVVGTTKTWTEQEFWHERWRCIVPQVWPFCGQNFYCRISWYPLLILFVGQHRVITRIQNTGSDRANFLDGLFLWHKALLSGRLGASVPEDSIVTWQHLGTLLVVAKLHLLTPIDFW